jgi:hypothetical protein
MHGGLQLSNNSASCDKVFWGSQSARASVSIARKSVVHITSFHYLKLPTSVISLVPSYFLEYHQKTIKISIAFHQFLAVYCLWRPL